MRVNPFRDRAAPSPWLLTQNTGLLQHMLYPRTHRGIIPLLLVQETPSCRYASTGTGCPHLQAVDEEVSSQTTLLAVGQELHQALHMALLQGDLLVQSLIFIAGTGHCITNTNTPRTPTPRLQGMVKSQTEFPWKPSFPALPSTAWRQLSQPLPRSFRLSLLTNLHSLRETMSPKHTFHPAHK